MNIFKQFVRALYDPESIASFRFQSIGKTFLYIFFLTFILFIPAVYNICNTFDFSNDKFNEFITTNNETLEIKEGKLVATPVETYVHEVGEFKVIIDSSSDEVNPKLVEDDSIYLAFLGDKIVLSNGLNEETITYDDLGIENVSNETIIKFFDITRYTTIGITSLFTYWAMTAGILLFVTLLAFAFKMISQNPKKNRELTYGQCWTIVAYSTTIVVAFLFIMDSFGIEVIARDLIVWLVTFIFSYNAFKTIPFVDLSKS